MDQESYVPSQETISGNGIFQGCSSTLFWLIHGSN